MEFVKSAKNKICHDCQTKIKIETEGKKIKNGKMLVYENEGKKTTIFKCNDCFGKSQELRNYQPCEIYSRVVGYLRPVQQWNLGKKREYEERKEYKNQQIKVKD